MIPAGGTDEPGCPSYDAATMTEPEPEAGLTPTQWQIVDLIADGFTRWKIAEELDMAQTTVREIIRRLCARHDCRMEHLPETLERRGLWSGS